MFIFAQSLIVDPLKPIGNSVDPLSCNSKTLFSQLFDYIKRKILILIFLINLNNYLGENLDKYNLIPSREKLQSTNELISFQNDQDFQQALSAIYSSLLN